MDLASASQSFLAPVQLNMVWEELEAQITPFTQVLALRGELFRALDEPARAFIAQKFMDHTLERVMYLFDGTGPDRYFLGTPKHFYSSGGLILKLRGCPPMWVLRHENKVQIASIPQPKLPTKPTKIPRPPNAYILYRKERHSLVKKTNPGITNNEISQVLGAAWNRESRETRQQYKMMSDEIKQRLLEKHPDYQYKPRKPSEKKRRARRNTQNQAANGDVA